MNLPIPPGTIFNAQCGFIEVVSLLGRGKSGYSHLARVGARDRVLKIMHDEPCAYYDFAGTNKCALEVKAYSRLRAMGLPMPRLLEYDTRRQYIVKEYVEGPHGGQMAAQGELSDTHFIQLRRLSTLLRQHDLNIDWFPNNFVGTPEGLVYVDYEHNPYDAQWSFEEWGVWYWANSEGMGRFLKDEDPAHINEPPLSGLPIRANPERVAHILSLPSE